MTSIEEFRRKMNYASAMAQEHRNASNECLRSLQELIGKKVISPEMLPCEYIDVVEYGVGEIDSYGLSEMLRKLSDSQDESDSPFR